MSEDLARTIPGARAQVVSNLRHMAAVEAPARVAGTLTDFLGRT